MSIWYKYEKNKKETTNTNKIILKLNITSYVQNLTEKI